MPYIYNEQSDHFHDNPARSHPELSTRPRRTMSARPEN